MLLMTLSARVQSQLNVLDIFCQRYGLMHGQYGENQIDGIQEWRALETICKTFQTENI